MTTPVSNPHKDYIFISKQGIGRKYYTAYDGTIYIKITEAEFKAKEYEEHFFSHPDAYDANCSSCFSSHPHSVGYHNQTVSKTHAPEDKTAKRLSDVTADELLQRRVSIKTDFDTFIISAITKDYWVQCPKANSGFGRSFCCHEGTQVLISDE